MKIKLITKTTGKGTVRLLLSYHCQTRQLFSTGVVIPLADLKAGVIEKPVQRSNPNADHYNKQVSLLYHEIQQIISTLCREDKIPSAALVSRLHNEKKQVILKPLNENSFEEIYQTFLNEKAFKHATLKLYKNMHSQLIECFPTLNLETFTVNSWTQFRKFLEAKGLSNNTICIRLNKLKAMLKHLKNNGIEIPIKVFPLPKEEIKKIFLDLKDLSKVIAFVPATDSMKVIKDLFIFQCHTALRISDLTRLNQTHVKLVGQNYFIQMSAFKTNKQLMIPLTKPALEILQRHKYTLPHVAEQYYNREIKRLLQQAGVTTIFEWQSYDTSGKKIYKSKELCKLFTNHCCSRTAIKYFFSLGFTPDQVARIVGKSLDTIMGYYYETATEEDIFLKTEQLLRKL